MFIWQLTRGVGNKLFDIFTGKNSAVTAADVTAVAALGGGGGGGGGGRGGGGGGRGGGEGGRGGGGGVSADALDGARDAPHIKVLFVSQGTFLVGGARDSLVAPHFKVILYHTHALSHAHTLSVADTHTQTRPSACSKTHTQSMRGCVRTHKDTRAHTHTPQTNKVPRCMHALRCWR